MSFPKSACNKILKSGYTNCTSPFVSNFFRDKRDYLSYWRDRRCRSVGVSIFREKEVPDEERTRPQT